MTRPSRPATTDVPALGKVGVWLPLHLPAYEFARTQRLARRIEHLGYGSLWSGEIPYLGREPFALHAALLSATCTLPTGTGIAHLGARTAATMDRGAATLHDGFPGRFVLGIGGHGAARGAGPVDQIRAYLDAMDTAAAQRPDGPGFARVLAALGPRMSELAAERADGAHSFLAPVEHTAYARDRLGPGRLLLPAQTVMLVDDRSAVRTALLGMFGGGPGRHPGSPYHANLRRFGYSDEEIERVADRVIDAMVAWGDEQAIAARVRAQLDAGASSVLVHPIPYAGLDVETQLDRLAPALLD